MVGSGPAGLACAAQLNQAGHTVTVFERADRIGGLLMYGIPNMKLDKKIVQRRIDLMSAEGVKFITNTEVGKDYRPAGCGRSSMRWFCAAGQPNRVHLPIEGRQLKGVHFAMEFLRANTQRLLDGDSPSSEGGAFISAKDKEVVIIGGGDTGTDCVATALRHGCRSLAQFEILDRLPASAGPITRGRSGLKSSASITGRRKLLPFLAATRAAMLS